MLDENYTVREAQREDADEIAFVHYQTWQISYQSFLSPTTLKSASLADRLALRHKVLEENSGVHLVATFEGKVVAFYDADKFRFHKNQKISHEQLKRRTEKGEVYALYILQDHQRAGVGSALFEAGRKKLQEKGLTPFIAWVLKDNHAAIAFYEKRGGKLVDEVRVVIGGGIYTEIAYCFN